MKEERLFEKKVHVFEVEESGKMKKMELTEEMICWEGYRKLRGNLVLGVPRRSPLDCLKYCCHPGCEFDNYPRQGHR